MISIIYLMGYPIDNQGHELQLNRSLFLKVSIDDFKGTKFNS